MMSNRFRRGFALAAAVGTIAAAGVASAAEPLRVTQPVQLTKGDVDPGRTYTTPSVAVDPGNPQRVVATVSEARGRKCGLARSLDGGRTWNTPDASPSPASYPFCFTANFGVAQGQLAFGRDGRLYYALPGWDVQDAGNRNNVSLVVARSDDLGDSWESTIVRNTRGKQEREVENAARPITSLVVDTRGASDVVYVTWTRTLTNAVAPNAEPVKPFVAVSRDGAKTFSEPIDLTAGVFNDARIRADALKTTTTTTPTGPTTTTTAPPADSRAAQPDQAGNFGGRDATLTVDDKGTVHVAWRAQSANITPATFNALFLSSSTDQGKTFTVTQITPWVPRARQPALRWSPEGTGSGTLHMVYEGTKRPGNVGDDLDIFYVRSTDAGKTWSEPRVLNDDDQAEVFANGLPNMSVAPNGRLDVVWWDLRNDPGLNYANDVYHTASSDNGQTWSKNLRVTDRIVDRRIGVFGRNFDVSAPPGLGASDDFIVVGWDDTRNATPGELGSGTQDLFTAAVQYAAVGGGTSRATKIVLAGFAGLVAVGLILLLVALARRRAAEPSLERKPSGKAPAAVG